MGALPRPTVPDGPVATLFARLHELHHQAGWPSLRDMAKDIGCSHTTISAAFSRPAVPRWGLLELIVETLGGDTDEFHQLWLAASRGGRVASPVEIPAATEAATAVPRQLSADVAGFTGRDAELAQLDDIVGTAAGAVVCGTAGVGKTALAVHWAHRAAERFPDGQLYVNLRGYDPGSPVTASAALESMLRELGVAGAAVPAEQDDRAARYRTLLSDRRVLVLLDNANSVDQVRDLLPGGSSCFALVTSRESMRGLVARHGAVRVNVDLLTMADAVTLLRTLVGRRVDDEPDEARILAERCVRLPLALRIAAELATARPALSLADLNGELSEEPGLLELLTAGDDEYSAVRTVFSWSCRHLNPPAAQLFAQLGLHPGRDIDRHAAAALADTQPPVAARLLDELARAHLLDEQRSGRYGMHDLLRVYARELGAALDTRADARRRLREYYLDTGASAMGAAYPFSHQRGVADTFADPDAARGWLQAEWRNLVALAEDEPERSAVAVSVFLADYLDDRSHYDAAIGLHELARATAAQTGDRASEGVALNNLALIDRRHGRYSAALDKHLQALAACREVGDRNGEGRALNGAGSVHWRQGNYQEAYDALHAAVTIQREVGDNVGEGNALYGLGIASRRLGHYEEAAAHHRQAIELLRAAGDRAGEGRALNNLGVVHMYLGLHDQALAEFEDALEIHVGNQSLLGEGVVRDNIATTQRRLGHLEQALAGYQDALAIYLDIGYAVGEGDALRGIGATLGLLGEYAEAIEQLTRAVELGRRIGEVEVTTGALAALGEVQLASGDAATASVSFQAAIDIGGGTGDPYYRAAALAGSGNALEAIGDRPAARERRQQALELYAAMGLPEADDLRAQLAPTT